MTTSTLSRIEYFKAYYVANREKIDSATQAYRKANPEKEAAHQKAYREANVKKILAASKAYREANPEKVKIKNKAYLEANPQKNALNIMAIKSKLSNPEIRDLVPQELIEVKALQLQLHRLIYARA